MTLATVSQSILGYSPHFAPLEQIQGDKTNPRSDLFALGGTLYNLLTNRLPPDALTRAAALLNDEADPLLPVTEINPGVPPPAASTLMRALALKPAQRPSSSADMRATLVKEASLLPTFGRDVDPDEVTVVTRGASATPQERKSIWVPWLISGVAAVLAVLAFVIFYNSRFSSNVSNPTDITNVSQAPAAGGFGSTGTT